MKKLSNNIFLVGVDGGGTKTDVWISDLNGKIVSMASGGPSNLRNVGIEKSIEVISETILKAFLNKKLKGKIGFIFVGLASISEEFKKDQEKIRKKIKNNQKIKKILKGDIYLDNDQIVGFRSGTDEKEGLVVIAGTGTSVRGWKDQKTIKSSGWGWLADEGSAFWTGQEVYKLILKSLDGRRKKSVLTDLIFKELKIKSGEELNDKIYKGEIVKNISFLSLIIDQASQKGNKEAIEILRKGGKEIALSVISVIKKLEFKQEFPLILIGGMFKCRALLNSFKKEVVDYSPKIKIITPLKPAVYGAIRLALEKYNQS